MLGQAMTEYMIVFPVMLVLIFGTLQFALLYQAKTQLNYAAFESARSGSLNNAQRWALKAGLVRGLAPIHTHGQGRNWLRWARSKVWDQIDAGLVEIQIISPSDAAFDSHGIDEGDDRVIPNDHLMYRDATVKGSGDAKITIQDANLLKIRVLYCVEMHVPFVNRMINALLRLGAPTTTGAGPSGVVGTGQLSAWANTGTGFTATADSFEELCLERAPQQHLPIMSEAIMRMQSAPIFDPPPAAGP
jgi:hypothetical protein